MRICNTLFWPDIRRRYHDHAGYQKSNEAGLSGLISGASPKLGLTVSYFAKYKTGFWWGVGTFARQLARPPLPASGAELVCY